MGGLLELFLLLMAVSLTILTSTSVHAGKILVFPLDGSHWINMDLLLRSLHARGHELTVVRTSTSWYIKESAQHYHSITITLPEAFGLETEDFMRSVMLNMLSLKKEGASLKTFLDVYCDMFGKLSKIYNQASTMVVEIFENKTLMQSLREAEFDVVLLDPGLPVGVLVAHELKLPTVYNLKFVPGGEGNAPSPSSYVPNTGYAVSDKMTFVQRIGNLIFHVHNAIFHKFVFYTHFDKLVDRYFGPDVSFQQLLHGADLWLMRVDFVFEFPRPTMPNMIYIGGFQCKPPEPLPPELEEFIQSSGEHGFILMSIGTFLQRLPGEITLEIAAAFAQLPQKVIWRHVGEPPENLGNNTLLMQWIPQNDLLGHPKIKAFVSHGGTNGIYESIYHGVPIIGIPLVFDQFENILRLETRGAAKVADATQLTHQDFLATIQEVLHNPSYRDNMKRLSELHRDKPAHPLETALFWIEFTMRHRGASHLRTESYKMPWYAYYSVDVVIVVLVVLLFLMVTVVGSIRFLCSRLCRRRKRKQE